MKTRALIVPIAMLCVAVIWSCQQQDGASPTASGQTQQGLALAKPAPSLVGTNEYVFMGALGIFDSEGRLLGWEGPISGDIEGTIQWWMVVPFDVTGQVTHFTDRWEIWSGGVLLMAGEEAGSTTARPGLEAIWRANGIVTEACPDYAGWIGRQVHDAGQYTWAAPGLPDKGTGTFRVN